MSAVTLRLFATRRNILPMRQVFADVPVMVRTPGWSAQPSTASVVLEVPLQEMEAIRTDQVSVVVHLPEPVPTTGLAVRMGEEGDSRFEVVHLGPPEVEVKAVNPSQFSVEPSP